MKTDPRSWMLSAALTLVLCLPVLLAPGALESQVEMSVLPYGVGDWDAETLGNHRIVVRVEDVASAVVVDVPWRRRDAEPGGKAVIVTDAEDQSIDNVARISVARERGVLAFEPTAGPGTYHVYFLPWVTEGRSNYPTVSYPAPEDRADAGWRVANGLDDAGLIAERWRELPRAGVEEVQAIESFHSFFPMEVIATAAETEALLRENSAAEYLVFPEDRRFPIRLRSDLPYRWIEAGAEGSVEGEALRGEWYAFQLGVWAARGDIADVEVRFTDLAANGGERIAAGDMRCVTLGGLDWTGKPFRKKVAIAQGEIQPLWCGIQVAEAAGPGRYRGEVTVTPAGMAATTLPIDLTVAAAAITAAGDDEPWRHSRLRWLDSMIALDDEVVAPYEPVRVDGDTVSILGRTIRVGEDGLPAAIDSYFPYEMTSVGETPRAVLAAPVGLEVVDSQGDALKFESSGPALRSRADGLATWTTTRIAGDVSMHVAARAEFDGMVAYEIAIGASADTAVSDIRLHIPIKRDVARYMMGMGRPGGERPASFDWTWDVERNQDGAWIGDVNAGLQFSMADEHYQRPLNTNFYQQKPLVMPGSWDNGGKGGCRMRETGDAYEVTCFSGERVLRAGEALRFDFKLLITPFHPIDTDRQWRTRFFHRFRTLDEIAEAGANTINVHHATDINPFINYPFMRPNEMKAYIDAAHERDMKVKIYYTVRELTNIAPELFALLSLGTEVFNEGAGGGYSWLQEHVDRGYIGGWFVPDLADAAIVTSGTSRWHNYYLEGLDWLSRNVGIDGLYIDDVAFDRTVMKRVRKILDRNRPGALIDLHSANQFNPRDGFANSANLYLEHFPYLDRLWFGEYFDYDSAPDFWMTEVAGIPFGLMGEMLQGGGNPWRGMLWGMTNRLPWSEDADPRPIWQAWDRFDMQGSQMIGYWVPDAPVTTSDPRVLATSYVQEGRTLVAIASWAESEIEIELDIDWQRLGLDPETVRVRAEAIENFQTARQVDVGDSIPVAPGRGWLLTISPR